MLLRHGDYIMKVKSHQAGLVAVMNEHVIWKGLRVKTFPRGSTTMFPGGAECTFPVLGGLESNDGTTSN
jgi:hypothetical protein